MLNEAPLSAGISRFLQMLSVEKPRLVPAPAKTEVASEAGFLGKAAASAVGKTFAKRCFQFKEIRVSWHETHVQVSIGNVFAKQPNTAVLVQLVTRDHFGPLAAEVWTSKLLAVSGQRWASGSCVGLAVSSARRNYQVACPSLGLSQSKRQKSNPTSGEGRDNYCMCNVCVCSDALMSGRACLQGLQLLGLHVLQSIAQC